MMANTWSNTSACTPSYGTQSLMAQKKLKFHRNTVVGRLQLPHHAGQFLIYIGKTFQISGQIGPEHTQIGLTTPVDKDGIVDMMFLIILAHRRPSKAVSLEKDLLLFSILFPAILPLAGCSSE